MNFEEIDHEIGMMMNTLIDGRTFIVLYNAYDTPPYMRVCANNAGEGGIEAVIGVLKACIQMFEIAVENDNVKLTEGDTGVRDGNRRTE